MMKLKKNTKSDRRGKSFAQVSKKLKTFHFHMKTKQQKTFSRGDPMPSILINLGLLIF